jgi:hypothetical protein
MDMEAEAVEEEEEWIHSSIHSFIHSFYIIAWAWTWRRRRRRRGGEVCSPMKRL